MLLYKILRDNIELGPFSKEEIIKQGLLPSDEIKLDGDFKWASAESFEIFKNAITPLHKPKFKITADKKIIEVKEDLEKNESIQSLNDSPFKRTPSAQPKKKSKESLNASTNTSRTYSAPSFIENIDNAPTLEARKTKRIKPTASKEKNSSSSLKKELIIPIFILAAVGFISWKVYNYFTNPANETVAVLSTATPTIDSSYKKLSQKTDSIKKAEVVNTKTNTISNTKDSSALLVKVDSAVNDAVVTVKDTPQTKAINTKVDSGKQAIVVTSQNKNNKKNVKLNNTNEQKTAQTRNKTIDSYVSLSLNKKPVNEVKNIKLWVANTSKQDLNIVVVDIKYLDDAGKMVAGETLQADNLKAGESKMLRIPNNKNASNLTYQVSLISGDNIYMMAH